MKKGFFFLGGLLLFLSGFGQHVSFRNFNFKKATFSAEAQDKNLFVYCYLGKEKAFPLDNSPFFNPELANFVKENFVCIQMDFETEEGREFGVTHEVPELPAILFFDGKGELIRLNARLYTSEDILSAAQIASNPKQQLPYFAENHQKRKKDKSFLRDYVKAWYDRDLGYVGKYHNLLGEWWGVLSLDEKMTSKNLDLYLKACVLPHHTSYRFILDNFPILAEYYGEFDLNSKIFKEIQERASKSYLGKSMDSFLELRGLIASSSLPLKEDIVTWLDLDMAFQEENWDDFCTLCEDYFEGTRERLSLEANERISKKGREKLTRTIYKNCQSDKLDHLILSWLEMEAVKNPQDYLLFEMVAFLSFRLENYKKCVTYGKKAMEIALDEAHNTDFLEAKLYESEEFIED